MSYIIWNVLSLYSWKAPCPICFLIFMMNGDFWDLQYCSGQSFINKYDHVKYVSLINVKVTITLSGMKAQIV